MHSSLTALHADPVRMSRLLLELVDNLDAMIAYWDEGRHCVFANEAYRVWFGKAREDIVGRHMRDLLGPTLYERNLPYLDAAFQGQVQVFEREIPRPEGGTRPSLATYTPHWEDGRVCGIYVHVADVSPLKRLEQALQNAKAEAEKLATHDFLTGLPNRVLLQQRLARAIDAASAQGRLVAVMTLDLDNFKRINDTWGHTMGDQVLVEVADRMRTLLRESDSMTRIGGDEFLMIASGIEQVAQAEHLAERLLNGMREPLLSTEAIIVPRFSLGLALYPQHGTTPEALIDNSDRALYVAKRLGRDRYAYPDD